MMNILLKNATVVDTNKKNLHLKKRDILIKKGIIEKIASKIIPPAKTKIIDYKNLHVSIGWFDSSISFGEPGYEERETIENGLKPPRKAGLRILFRIRMRIPFLIVVLILSF